MDSLVFLDVETTGTSSRLGRVIEIGAIKVVNGEVVDRFETFIDPEEPLSPFITALTGIRDQDLVSAPTFLGVMEDLEKFLEGSVFVAHNAAFDYAFIREEYKRLGVPFAMPRLCTVRLSRTLYPEERKHSLSALIERFSISCVRRHRAMDDAQALVEFWKLAEQQHGSKKLSKAAKYLVKKPRKIVGLEYMSEVQ